MKAMNTFGVQFIIRLDKLKDGKAPIYARVTVNGEIIHFAVKQWIDPKCWDQRKGVGKGNKDDVKIINGGLDQIRFCNNNNNNLKECLKTSQRFCLIRTNLYL